MARVCRINREHGQHSTQQYSIYSHLYTMTYSVVEYDIIFLVNSISGPDSNADVLFFKTKRSTLINDICTTI